jgi:hypothetical protein
MIDALPTPRRRFRRFGLRAILVVLVVVVAGGAWLTYKAVNTALHAEMALHATNEVCDLVKRYVQQHDGAWPRSWHDLEQVNCPPGTYNVFPWPEKSPELQQFVAINFAADPKQLATQSPADFEAIKPIGPHYPYKQDGFVESLLESLRSSRKAKKAAPGIGRH